jgi:hypothetical protein
MAILTINTGSGPNSNDGDSIRTAFHKTNINFQELSTLLGTTGTNLVEVVIDTNAQLFNHNSHTGVSIVYNDPANILIMSVDPGPQGPSGSVGPSGPSGPVALQVMFLAQAAQLELLAQAALVVPQAMFLARLVPAVQMESAVRLVPAVLLLIFLIKICIQLVLLFLIV